MFFQAFAIENEIYEKVLNACVYNNDVSESHYLNFCHELENDLNSEKIIDDFMNYCMQECLRLHSSQRPNRFFFFNDNFKNLTLMIIDF